MTESLEQEIRTLRSLFWSERDPDGRGFAPLADAYRRAGEVRQALDLLADGLVRHPEFVPGHVVAAQLYVEQGLHAESELAARRALELDPENVNALRSLTAVLQESGRESEAGDVQVRLADLEPDGLPTGAEAVEVESEPATEGAHDEAVAAVEDALLEAEGVDPVFWVAEPSGQIESGPLGNDEAVFDLGDLAAGGIADMPDPGLMAHYEPSEEPVELSDLGPGAPLGSVESVFDLGDLASDEPAEESLDIGAMAPDEPAEAAFDIGAMAPDEPAEEAFDIGAMAPDEPAEEAFDIGAMAPDEPAEAAFDIGAMAPDEPAEEAFDIGAMAPDEPAEAAFDIGAMAPDEPAEEAFDIGAMAPDEPAEAAFDIGAMAPDEPAEEAFDIGAMAPDEPAEEAFDIGAMAPDEPAEEAFDIGAMAPDEPAEAAFDIGAMAPDEPAEETVEPAEPLYTRTLAELYVRQGFTDRAIEVLRHLLEEDPSDADLAMRLTELHAESGAAAAETGAPDSTPDLPELERAFESAGPQELGDVGVAELEVPSEEEIETLARDLAESGDKSHEVDSPFAWIEEEAEEEADAGPTIGEYFDGLLGWQSEDGS